MKKTSYFSENTINWKNFHKLSKIDLSDPTSLNHSLEDLTFNKLSTSDLHKIPQHLIHKYFNLSKLALDHYTTQKQSLESELSLLNHNKSPNFLKKLHLESSLNKITQKLSSLNTSYTHNKELLISKYEKSPIKNIGKINNGKLTPCEFCKKVFETPEFYQKHITRRHNTLQRPTTTDSQIGSSLENSLIRDFNNFTNDRIQKFLDLSKQNFESLRTLKLDSSLSPSRSFNFSKLIEDSYSVRFDELKSFQKERLREQSIFKLELENQALKDRKSMLDRDLEDIRKLRLQESQVLRRVEKGGKNKWKKWVSEGVEVTSKVKVKEDDYKVQDSQALFILGNQENSVIHCESPNISIIAFKPDTTSNIDSIKSRLYSLFSPPQQPDAKYPASHFPFSPSHFSQTRQTLNQKLTQCINHIKTDPSNLTHALNQFSKLFHNK